jgi:hypothetical protein
MRRGSRRAERRTRGAASHAAAAAIPAATPARNGQVVPVLRAIGTVRSQETTAIVPNGCLAGHPQLA